MRPARFVDERLYCLAQLDLKVWTALGSIKSNYFDLDLV